MTIGYRYSQLDTGPSTCMKPENPAERRVRPWYLRAKLKRAHWRARKERGPRAVIAVPSQTSQSNEDSPAQCVDSKLSDTASLPLKSAKTETNEGISLLHSVREVNHQANDESIKMEHVEAHACYRAWLRFLQSPPPPYSRPQDTCSSMELDVMQNRKHSFRDFKPLAVPAVRPEHSQMELSTSAQHRLLSTKKSASDGRTTSLFPDGDHKVPFENAKSAFDWDSESSSDDGSVRSSLSQCVDSEAESLRSLPVLKNGFNRLRKASMSSLRSICQQFSDGSHLVNGTGGECEQDKRAS